MCLPTPAPNGDECLRKYSLHLAQQTLSVEGAGDNEEDRAGTLKCRVQQGIWVLQGSSSPAPRLLGGQQLEL